MEWALRRQGKYGEVAETMLQARSLCDLGKAADDGITAIAQGFARQGRSGFLHGSMALHKTHHRPSYYLARDSADLGDNEAALAFLETAYKTRDSEILWMLLDPEFDSLRSEPRFLALLKKVGLPQPAANRPPQIASQR
jgi:hypothetical protein